MQWGTAKSMEVPIAEEIRKRGLRDHVRSLGYVPANDLEALYREAVALTFPSRFEGFGAPVLEAMARRCPVIAADATALPEVVQSAGRLVSPDNAEQWAHAMIQILDDDAYRKELQEAGLERARAYTWERSADILEDAYRHVLATTL
jgi:alpha-1,3-rhamnosyl/mannosyltransferase